jgi:hypothetical protein
VIGWIGDSGNPEHTQPHLHFELRNRSGYPIDPYRSLRKSSKVTYEWLSPDASAASIALSLANHADGAPNTFVVTKDDFGTLEESEITASVLHAPLIVIDPESPEPALAEIARLNSSRIVVFSDDVPPWLVDRLMHRTMIVEPTPLPVPPPQSIEMRPDDTEPPPIEPDTPDRFATIITGRVDDIRRSHRDEYADFIRDHRSLVLTDEHWANRSIGQNSWNYPGRYGARGLLWWTTGDGWISTESLDDVPYSGYVYLTEKRATSWNLAYLSSLTELPPMPVWRGER